MRPLYKAGDVVETKDGQKVVVAAYPTIGSNVVYTLEGDNGLWEQSLLRACFKPRLNRAPSADGESGLGDQSGRGPSREPGSEG
jgi:hypothetical protein